MLCFVLLHSFSFICFVFRYQELNKDLGTELQLQSFIFSDRVSYTAKLPRVSSNLQFSFSQSSGTTGMCHHDQPFRISLLFSFITHVCNTECLQSSWGGRAHTRYSFLLFPGSSTVLLRSSTSKSPSPSFILKSCLLHVMFTVIEFQVHVYSIS